MSVSKEYQRFLDLGASAYDALTEEKNEDAARFAEELLVLAENYRDDWNYGNAVHHSHIVLGRAALASGDAESAVRHLLSAGHTPGSPQLNSFGPNMSLADELLLRGKSEAVLQFFALCGRFWTGSGKLEEWKAHVKRGWSPEFGPNLYNGREKS